MNTIKIRVVRRCHVSATRVAEPGEIVDLEVPSAANMMGYGGGEAVDPADAAAKIRAWNAAAVRAEERSRPPALLMPFVRRPYLLRTLPRGASAAPA